MAAQTIGLQLGNQMGRLWRSYERVLKKRPVLTQATTSAALWSVGDLIAQRLETIGKEKKVRRCRGLRLVMVVAVVVHYCCWGQSSSCCCCWCSACAAGAQHSDAANASGLLHCTPAPPAHLTSYQ